jgi:hypothetical protein
MYLAACHRARMGREKLTEAYALKRRSILPLQGDCQVADLYQDQLGLRLVALDLA